MKIYGMVFRWGTSRGRDTYGYTTCSCRIEGKRMGFASGGGYDLKGSAFGGALVNLARGRIFDLARSGRAHSYTTKTKDGAYTDRRHNNGPDSLYGLSATVDESGSVVAAYVDGACGFDSVVKIAQAAGYTVRRVDKAGDVEMYTIEGGDN